MENESCVAREHASVARRERRVAVAQLAVVGRGDRTRQNASPGREVAVVARRFPFENVSTGGVALEGAIIAARSSDAPGLKCIKSKFVEPDLPD